VVCYLKEGLTHEHQTSSSSHWNNIPGTIISLGVATAGDHMTEQSSPNSVSVNAHGVLIKEDLR
jgi:hypothetical protein